MSRNVTLPRLEWRRSPNQSDRRGAVRLVVVHRPVGSYQGSIEALCDPKHDASAHVIVRDDGLEATQLVAWDRKAWSCVAFNSVSDNIETPDVVWTASRLSPKLETVLRVCARIVAFRLYKRGLQAEYISGSALLDHGGFTRHADLGKAGGGHSDPTTDLNRWGMFCALVEAEFLRGGFRQMWGRGDNVLRQT